MALSSNPPKPKSSQYAPLNVQIGPPKHKQQSQPLSKHTNHKKPENCTKSISHKLLDLKLKHSATSNTLSSAYSDSESSDSKAAPKLTDSQFLYNFGANEQLLKQELIESLLEQLKIGLTFLLHDESPLWNNEMDEDDDETNMKHSVYAKGSLSTPSIAKNDSIYSVSHLSHTKSTGFQQRCTQYTKSGIIGGFKKNQQRLNALFDIKYIQEYKSLYKLWTQWVYYTKLKEDGHRIHISHLKLRDQIQENHAILEDDCIDFVESKTITKKSANAIVSALNKLRGKTDVSDTYLAKSATISSLRNKLGNTQRSLSTSPRKTMHLPVIVSDEECSEHQLKTVKTRQEMKKWIERFKSTTKIENRSCYCCGVKWIKVCFGQLCCECKGVLGIEKEDKNLRIPMDLWSWQNVVACIEDAVYVDDDGEQYELKHFASVFWQYQIEGKELVVMDVLQIELLVECWFLNNIQEQFFDEVKLKFKQEDDEAWHLSQESEYLMRYIDKLRIHSHIVSRYQLSMDIVHLIVSETEQNIANPNNIYEDAMIIKYCIELLRSNVADGPKQYWKVDAHYFNKIDNYLSVLVCAPIIRQMYQKCVPDLLYEEPLPATHDNDDILDQETLYSPLPAVPIRSTLTHSRGLSGTNANAFHSIQARLNRDAKSYAKRHHDSNSALYQMTQSRKYDSDVLDKCADKCCDNALCLDIDWTSDYTECIHNLDRIYIKTLCLIMTAMLLGCLFIIIYYYHHGIDQANDAMFLSLEAIGDRLTGIMSNEFWIPQMVASLTIGGLTTGDLLPNASLYSFPHYKYDQFFASFTTLSHTTAVFSVFLYNQDLNTMIGAYRMPNDADVANGSTVIIDYNGTCRQDRLYDDKIRMRMLFEPYGVRNSDLPNYLNCEYDAKTRDWYLKAQNIGVGRSQWTEPYVFNEEHQGMSYVAPVLWKGINLIFVVEVTTYTLSVAVSHEVQHLPEGSLWMIVTPGLNAVASSVNETWIAIDDANCTNCYSDNDMIRDAIEWMKQENVSIRGEQHLTAYPIDYDHDISLYSFPINHVNLHPKPPYADSNEYMVKPLQLNNASDYQYGIAVIVNDEHYVSDVRNAYSACWCITFVSITGVLILIMCNIRYNMIEQRNLGRQGRSGIIRATSTKRLRVASSKISSFHQKSQISQSRSFDSMTMPISPMLLHKTTTTRMPVIGDRIKTKDNKYGTVKFIDKVSGTHDTSAYVLVALEGDKGTVLVPLANVIALKSASPHVEQIRAHPINRSMIDNKILNSPLPPIRKAGETPETEDEETKDQEEDDIGDIISDEEEDHTPVTPTAGQPQQLPRVQGTTITHTFSNLKPPPPVAPNLSVIEDEEDILDTAAQRNVVVYCCGYMDKQQWESVDARTKKCCYFPQKTLLYIAYVCLCVTLIILVFIWEVLTTDATSTLFEDVMAKNEWSHVQDLVYQLFASTEMIADAVTDRFYRNDMDLNNSHELDRFFVNIMQSFVDPLSHYKQWYVYIATPAGNMRGARWNTSHNVSTLSAALRDESTNHSYNVYLINDRDGYHMKNILTDTLNDVYDPRCRGWYRDTLYYAFEGRLDQAFPNDSYIEWKADINAPTYNITNCKENRDIYESMWNISNISQPQLWMNNTWKYDGEAHKMVWSRYLFATMNEPQIGLTGSMPIIDPVSGELLAIVAIDYTLNVVSDYIARTVHNPHDDGRSQISYDNWRSWIFESNGEPTMIASSDGKVLRDAKETEGCYGFLVAVENQKVPYNANEHPERLIRVYSEEVMTVHGIDSLVINATQSTKLAVPQGAPQLEAGRVTYYPGGNYSIDWVILKTTDVSNSFVDDLQITCIAIMLIMACVWVLLKELDYTDKMELSDLLKRKKSDAKHGSSMNLQHDLDRTDYLAIMHKAQPIVDGAANSKWLRMMNEWVNSMPGYAAIITTDQAKTFLANRANEHIASENENNHVFRECAWHACNYESLYKRFQLHFWEFIESNCYDVPVQLLLLAHLVTTFWEPSTPKELAENGLDQNLVYALAAFQFIQWCDCVLVGTKRFFEFKIKEPFLTSLYELNYGFNHKFTLCVKASGTKFTGARKLRAFYLTFRGPHCKRYIVHMLMVYLDFVNFILQIAFRVAPFSYYLPILPVLIIVRNHHVLLFGADFISAIIYAKDVLFSYFCFILIFAVLSMSLFSDRVNYLSFADSFESINNAFITGFVFISTSENYAIMYDIFESEYYSDSHWVVLGNVVVVTIFFAMMGMFCWIPMIIDKFEQAFEESNMHHDQKHTMRKTNAIIASFVLLDFNGDMDIDRTEFECLITCSVLIEKNKLFNAFDGNNSNSLDIYEFVQCLLKQSFRTKVMASSAQSIDSKFTAFAECNIFRHREYPLYIFVFLVIPVIGFSVIKGLSHRFDEDKINTLIGVFFLLNMCEIHLRCFCFGCGRFWDRLKYPNPNYVIAAIDQYTSANSTAASEPTRSKYTAANVAANTIRLTSMERNWVCKHLREVRPLSILEKSTQTLINRIELVSFWFCFAAWAIMQTVFELHQSMGYYDDPTYGNDGVEVHKLNDRYCLYFLQLAVMLRIFTVVPSNQQLIYIIFQVFPDFVALFVFLGLYIYSWARIGCTLFGDNKTDIVLPEIYEPAADMVANFDSLSYAILALIQLMIGEGWHEVMYFNTIGTNQFNSLYFIIYITVCSLIIANVFVGLFLADIDELTQQQSHDEIIKHSTIKSKSFQVYAKQKLNKLFYQIEQNQTQNELMTEQIQHINAILLKQRIQHHRHNSLSSF
eukprot:551634_1